MIERQTNFDRIRSSSIDKLIEWYCYHRNCGMCPYGGVECGIREWLMQEEEPPEAINVYDEREVHNNCTVEIWKNTKTGRVSVGWYENG